MLAEIERHREYFHGDNNEPGIFTRLALAEDFLGIVRKLMVTGALAVVGLWANLIWQIVEHYTASKGGP